jgi:hypothetical protein
MSGREHPDQWWWCFQVGNHLAALHVRFGLAHGDVDDVWILGVVDDAKVVHAEFGLAHNLR